MINNKMLEHEINYTKCFSKFYEDDNIVRFYDDSIVDMYDTNYTFIKKEMNLESLKCYINNEIKIKKEKGSNFCNIYLNQDASKELISSFNEKPSVEILEFYKFDTINMYKFKNSIECEIRKINKESMVQDELDIDLSMLDEDVDPKMKDFSIRKVKRLSKVFLDDSNEECYICYKDNNVIGSCELFVKNNMAKIENFLVMPKYQRKGYGTAILKKLIEISIKEKAETIYLVAYEDDTPREMYKKLGFKKVGEETQLFFSI